MKIVIDILESILITCLLTIDYITPFFPPLDLPIHRDNYNNKGIWIGIYSDSIIIRDKDWEVTILTDSQYTSMSIQIKNINIKTSSLPYKRYAFLPKFSSFSQQPSQCLRVLIAALINAKQQYKVGIVSNYIQRRILSGFTNYK